jgi:hypothetical protein
MRPAGVRFSRRRLWIAPHICTIANAIIASVSFFCKAIYVRAGRSRLTGAGAAARLLTGFFWPSGVRRRVAGLRAFAIFAAGRASDVARPMAATRPAATPMAFAAFTRRLSLDSARALGFLGI